MDATPPTNALAEPTPASASNAEVAFIVWLFLLREGAFIFASGTQFVCQPTDRTLAHADGAPRVPVLNTLGEKLAANQTRTHSRGSANRKMYKTT